MAITDAVEAFVASDRLPFIGAALVAIIAAAVVPSVLGWNNSLSEFPAFGTEYGDEKQRQFEFLKGARRLYVAGYRKFADTAFRMTTMRTTPVICIPARFLPELHKYGDETISVSDAIADFMQTKYTNLPSEEPTLVHMIKADLTGSLRRLTPMIYTELASAMRERFGECADWTEVNPNYALLQVVGQVSGRLFIGEELCRDPAYLAMSINYTVKLMEAVRAVTVVPTWKRFFTVEGLPEVKDLRKLEAEAFATFLPIVRQRLEERKDPNYAPRDDLMQWSIDRLAEKGMVDENKIARYQLTLTFAAIHTTTTTALNAVYTLASMPEIVPELREEARRVLDEANGTFTASSIQDLKKIDSFVREDMRMHALGSSSFIRYIRKPITLSNGQRIPAGVTIEVPSAGINQDETLFPNPEKFDALRFYNQRASDAATGSEAASANARAQMVSVTPEHLTFGFGRHACPGRFFAASEVKMIMAHLLLNYDMQLIDTKERYPNMELVGQCIPDPYKNIRLKRVEL